MCARGVLSTDGNKKTKLCSQDVTERDRTRPLASESCVRTRPKVASERVRKLRPNASESCVRLGWVSERFGGKKAKILERDRNMVTVHPKVANRRAPATFKPKVVRNLIATATAALPTHDTLSTADTLLSLSVYRSTTMCTCAGCGK